jgi:MFS family permease
MDNPRSPSVAFATKRWYTRPVIANYVQTLRLFGRNLRLFLVSAALVGLAWDGVRAVLFNLYLLRLGYGPESVGLINAVGSLSFALSCPLAGAMGVRWSSRKMIIAGLSLMTAGFWLLPLADALAGDWRTAWLLAVTVLTYLGFAIYLVNGLPYMMAATGSKERNHAFSVHIALIPLAAFAGSLLAGALPGVLSSLLDIPLATAAPYRYPLWLPALLLVPGVLALLRTHPIDEPQAQEPATEAPQPRRRGQGPYALIAAVALVVALRFGGRGTIVTFFNVYLDAGLDISTAVIGALSAISQLLAVPAALVAPLVVARWGNARTILWGTVGMALCALPLALLPHWAMAGLGFATSGLAFTATTGPTRVFSQELVVPRWRATMASAYMMGAGLAISASSLLGGYVIADLGYRALFGIGSALIAVAAFLFWFWFRVPRGKLASQPVAEGGE